MVRLSTFTFPPISSNCNSNLISDTIKQQCLSLLRSCSSMKQLFQIHARILVFGLQSDAFVADKIIQFCALYRSGSLSYARIVISHSQNAISSSWNNLIRGYAIAKSDSSRHAVEAFLEMRRSGIRPNELTYPFLFKSCAAISGLVEGKQIHCDVLKHGVANDLYVQNTLVHFYGSCRLISDACQVFDKMPARTVVSWNSIISACIENSSLYDSIHYFVKMRDSGFDPDETTMVILLSACAELGNLSLGKWIHSQVIERGLSLNCQLGTALVNMYSKCGSVDYASQVFDKMPERNVWTWSSLILGFAQHGFASESLRLFSAMKNTKIKPNYVTFLGVLCACSHGGLVNHGRRFFHEMQHKYMIKPMKVHYGAMVDLLSRSGLLQEAYDFITNMPIDPDPIIWRTLLSSCNIHRTNVGLVVAKVRERLMELEPRRSGNLVIVANEYAELGLWERATMVRKSMKNRGLKKVAGESCLEIGGSIFRFYSGDVMNEGLFLLVLDSLVLHMEIG